MCQLNRTGILYVSIKSNLNTLSIFSHTAQTRAAHSHRLVFCHFVQPQFNISLNCLVYELKVYVASSIYPPVVAGRDMWVYTGTHTHSGVVFYRTLAGLLGVA